MANIDTYLQAIMAAIYGEEVRGSIHDAIQEINNVVQNWESGLMDTTLTSTTLPAQGKAVGDAIEKMFTSRANLTSNDDIDNIVTIGTYAKAPSATPLNWPLDSSEGGRLFVFPTVGAISHYTFVQMAIGIITKKMAYRICGSSSWGEWVTVANEATVLSIQDALEDTTAELIGYISNDKPIKDRSLWSKKRVDSSTGDLVNSPSQLTNETILYVGKNNIIRLTAETASRSVSISYYSNDNGQMEYIKSTVTVIRYIKYFSAEYDFVRISFVGSTSSPPLLSEFGIDFIKVSANEFLGKNIAFLGDSITTYSGISETSSSFNSPYYPTNDIEYPEQCYWKMFFDAVSGANVSVSAISNSSYRNQGLERCPSAYETSRISRLALNGTPDYVFINMGTNDPYSSNIGDSIDLTYDIETLESEVVYSSYAIQATIRKIQNTYPNAKIILIIPKFASAIGTGNYTFEHWEKICNFIIQVANLYGCYKVVDMRKCGITVDTMSDDCISGAMHPNFKGMKKMGTYLINTLLGTVS